MAKRQSFMMETKIFDIKKSKTEPPNLSSKQNQVHVKLFFSYFFMFLFLFLERILCDIKTTTTHKYP